MRLVFAFSCKPTQRERFPDFNVFGALVGDPHAASHGRNESDEDEDATVKLGPIKFKCAVFLSGATSRFIKANERPVAQSLDECEFTSIKRRLEETSVDDPMTALGKQAVIPFISAITLDNYLELVPGPPQLGRQLRADSRPPGHT